MRYAGTFPEEVERLVVIEGWGGMTAADQRPTAAVRMREWIETQRSLAGRQPRRYANLDDAYRRMHDANPHLSPEHARHLTIHGTNQNEDGTYSWKFDNYTHASHLLDIAARRRPPAVAEHQLPRAADQPARRACPAPADRRMRSPPGSATPGTSWWRAPGTGCSTTSSTASSSSSRSSSPDGSARPDVTAASIGRTAREYRRRRIAPADTRERLVRMLDLLPRPRRASTRSTTSTPGERRAQRRPSPAVPSAG